MSGDLCININQALGALAAILGWALAIIAVAAVAAWFLASLPEILTRKNVVDELSDGDWPHLPEGLRAPGTTRGEGTRALVGQHEIAPHGAAK